MNSNNVDIEKYLQEKNVRVVRTEGKEIVVRCLFSGCDSDSKGKEAHLYFERESGLYHCKKCGAEGNIITLKKHFGDFTTRTNSQVKIKRNFTQNLVQECADSLPINIREYLNGRGVSDEIIAKYKIGFGPFYSINWITIPMIKPGEVEPSFFYLRKDPNNKKDEKMPKNLSFPKGKGEVILFGEYADKDEDLVICEGIMDCLSLLSLGIKALCSTGGCMTFKEEWIDEKLLKAKNIYVAYDRDEAGDKGSEKVLKLLKEAKYKNLHKVILPEQVGDKGDVNDYIAKFNQPVDELFTKYAEKYPKEIDTAQFEEINLDYVDSVLSQTITKEKSNKLLTFLSYNSAFTESNQFNVMFSAPSSTGKTYTALETVKLFPQDSVMKLGHSFPTAFFHETGKYDKETNTITVDLHQKILIFTENQHYQLLEKLRGFLSHDTKITVVKITDKGQQGGNKTKTVNLVGYPAVVFCTAALKADMQEKTRFIILSPEISQEKIEGGIKTVISKESKGDKYVNNLADNPERKSLMLRLEAIKNAGIKNIYISDEDSLYLEKKYLKSLRVPEPRHQRDIQRILCIAKSIALLNLWFRNLEGESITLNRSDIDSAFALYGTVAMTQNLGISTYLYNLYNNIIRPCYLKHIPTLNQDIEKYNGPTYQQIIKYHWEVTGTKLDATYLRQNIVPELEACGLVDKVYANGRVYINLTDTTDLTSEYMGRVITEKNYKDFE